MNPICMSKHPSRNNTWCDRAPGHVGPHRDSDGLPWEARPAGSDTRADDDGLTLLMVQQQRDQATARAVKAEQALAEMTAHRDQCRDTATKWQTVANRADQARPVTLSGVDLAATRRAMGVLHGMGYRVTEATVGEALAAALTTPQRPEGAEELEADMAEWYGENGVPVGGTGDRLADHLAALGYRKAES